MNRFLTLMMIVVLTMAHGSSVSAAICRHASGVEHAAALESTNVVIAAVALGEEAAGKIASSKGPPADTGSVSWPSDMLPMAQLPVPLRATEPAERNLADPPILVGAAVRPLLEPPAA
jgi:hypothetical protein